MGRRKGNAVPFSLFAFQDIITSVTGIILLITMMMAVELVQNMQRAESAPQEQKAPLMEHSVRTAISQNTQEIDRLQKLLDETTTIRYDADALRRRLAALSAAAKELEQQHSRIEKTQDQIDERRAELAQKAAQLSPELIEKMVQEQQHIADQIAAMRQANRVIFNRPDGAAKSPWLVELNDNSILTAEMGLATPPLSFATPEEFLKWVETQDRGVMYFVILVKPNSIGTFSMLKKELQDRQFEVGFDLLNSDQTAIDAQTGAGVR